MWACLAVFIVAFVFSFLFRLGVSTILPFEVIIVAILGLIVGDILYGMIKFIPVKDKRTGQTKTWAIGTFSSSSNSYIFATIFLQLYDAQYTGTWLHMPASHRFDLKARAAVKRGLQTTYVFQSKHEYFVSSYI